MRTIVTLMILAAAMLAAQALAMTPWDDEAQQAELARVREMIKRNGYTWQAGETSVSVLSPEERAAMRSGLIVPPNFVEPAEEPGVANLTFPAAFDWRTQSGVSPVKNQGSCGSCWAFCLVGGLESFVMIYDHWTPDLSEQQLVSCNTMGYSCSGGWLDAADVLVNPGAITEACQPYTASSSTACRQSQCQVVASLDGWQSISSSITSIKTALESGPVPVAMYAYDDLSSYQSGCYEGPTTSSVNHGVLIVGWNDNICPNGSWIVKNSWGQGWGDGGFFNIEYGNCNIGYGAVKFNYTPSTTVALAYANRTLVDDSGDGVLDPGEGATIKISLINSGSSAATGVYADLRCTNMAVTFNDRQATWANIAAGATAESQSPHFDITVGSSIQVGATLTFNMTIYSNEGSWTGSFMIPVGQTQTIYYTGFEGTSAEGWTHGQTSTQDDWQRGTPGGAGGYDPAAAYAGTKAWGNDLGASGWDGNYKNGAANYLLSPVIDCSSASNVHLQFMRWLSIESGQYDQARILVNGTTVWTNPTATDLVDTAWTPIDLNISAIADHNSSVQVRFELSADGGVTFGGWNIDEFKLTGNGGSSPTSTPTPAGPTATPTPRPTATPTATPTQTSCTVQITWATYLASYQSLRVNATCSQQPGAVLTVYANGTTYLGQMTYNANKSQYTFKYTTSTRPTYVQVRSDCGGSATANP